MQFTWSLFIWIPTLLFIYLFWPYMYVRSVQLRHTFIYYKRLGFSNRRSKYTKCFSASVTLCCALSVLTSIILVEYRTRRYSSCACFWASDTWRSVETPKILWSYSPPILTRILRFLVIFLGCVSVIGVVLVVVFAFARICWYMNEFLLIVLVITEVRLS